MEKYNDDDADAPKVGSYYGMTGLFYYFVTDRQTQSKLITMLNFTEEIEKSMFRQA